ncbi:hypothetical protein, partial [Rhizobium tropici]|uniref:hypothetical protein n=1 Tax=Rhizobium tropici TaxID=398 RepID=UPI001A92AEA2
SAGSSCRRSSVVSLRLALSNPTLPEITDGYEIKLHHSMGHDLTTPLPKGPACTNRNQIATILQILNHYWSLNVYLLFSHRLFLFAECRVALD